MINGINARTKKTSLVEKRFPIKSTKKREWLRIAKLLPKKPVTENDISWGDILPKEVESLATVLEKMVNNSHPFRHQKEAFEELLDSKEENKDLIINGGTYSGKSISFIAPGIVKLLKGEIDSLVLFYPTKMLLMDQFEYVKKMVVNLEKETSVRLNVGMYTGDTGRSVLPGKTGSKKELYNAENHPPNILLATFDKVWYQILTGNKSPLIEKILNCQYLVFDEIHAFEGFAAAIIRLFLYVHKIKNPSCQIILSSATIDRVSEFRDSFLPDAKVITCPPVRGELVFRGLTREHTISLLLELWKDLEAMPGKTCLVFADSKDDIEFLAEKLCESLRRKYEFFVEKTIAVIHADMGALQRKKVLDELQKGEQNNIRIVISSSVLELGVNIPNIQTVINIGVPITQKDGIVQRMARNRSKPGERRMNLFIFDLENPRDKFYWEHKEILKEILETNACNPILFPKRNTKVFAGILILLIRYGITDFQEIMNLFLREGLLVHEFARQQYARLVTKMVLKKNNGKIMFTSKGEGILKENKELVPFSIRAIDRGWAIKQMLGYYVNDQREFSKQIGKITTRDVLRKGLPGNLIIRNKQKYLVQDIDHQTRSIYVKKYLSDRIDGFEASPMNSLSDSSIMMSILPKVAQGPVMLGINFGQLTIERKPKAIANYDSERMTADVNNKGNSNSYSWQELTEEEAQEYSVKEKAEGIIFSLRVESVTSEGRSNKEMLNLFGKMLLIETEVVLGIPSSEIGQINNNKQLALYDKGKGKGNANYLFKHLRVISEGLKKRLIECSCLEGCKNCYGEIIGELPKGAKDELILLAKDLVKVAVTDSFEKLEEEMVLQANYLDDKIIALSDIHLGSENSLEKEFYEAISTLSKQADIIIINGDLLDKGGMKGQKAVKKLLQKAIKEGFWSKLIIIRSSTIHDASLANFANIQQQDYTWLETEAGEVLFVHGNKIGIDPKDVEAKNEEGATIVAKGKLVVNSKKTGKARSWLPRITEETHLVIGHLHKRFYNERFRVYGLGHWTSKGKKRDQKCYMLIDSSNTLNELQLRSY